MFTSSLKAGISAARRRPGLALLVYGADLALAAVLSVPLYHALGSAVGRTGHGPDLARGFDLVLWADVMEQVRVVFGALGAQLFWMLPLYLGWKAAAAVGLVHALRGSGARSFWQGVGRYGASGLLLALAFALPVALLLPGAAVASALVEALWGGEVARVWFHFVLLPLGGAAVLALLDLMHDYARIALVAGEERVRAAIRTGLAWPFRRPAAIALYAAWLVPAALLVAAPTLMDAAATAGTGASIWLLFLLQQACLVLRAAATVGWLGSEVAFYETVCDRERPLIADASLTDAPLLASGDYLAGTP